MPLISSTFKAPFGYSNNHLQTIVPGILRKVRNLNYQRERITTPDNDFLDLDWSSVDSKRLVIVLHGLEGATDRPYVRGLIKCANAQDWDGVGLNFRGCSGTPNLAFRSYHSGVTDDVELVVKHILSKDIYDEIAIVGFSLSGNVALKYAGEQSSQIDPKIKKVVGVSVPCDLVNGSKRIAQRDNFIYLRRFMTSLKEKIADKEKRYPKLIDYERLRRAKTFYDFDDTYTGPAHGFQGALDYYTRCSSILFIPNITIPTLILNAKDDSFLSDSCYPIDLAKRMDNVFLEMPQNGGHVGFMSRQRRPFYWSEERIMDFLNGN